MRSKGVLAAVGRSGAFHAFRLLLAVLTVWRGRAVRGAAAAVLCGLDGGVALASEALCSGFAGESSRVYLAGLRRGGVWLRSGRARRKGASVAIVTVSCLLPAAAVPRLTAACRCLDWRGVPGVCALGCVELRCVFSALGVQAGGRACWPGHSGAVVGCRPHYWPVIPCAV